MDHPVPAHGKAWRNGVTVAIIISVLFIGLGIQQIMYQKDKDERDLCSETWAKGVIDVLDTRVNANDRVAEATVKRDRAERQRDNAVDDVLLLVRALQRQDPPPAPEEQQKRFEVALQKFFLARENLTHRQAALDNVVARADETKKKNPYPKFRCGG